MDRLSKEELLRRLKIEVDNGDTEAAHASADDLLIRYIDDEDVTSAYDKIGKWYA